MRKIALLLFFALSVTVLKAQGGFAVNETDPYTKEHILETYTSAFTHSTNKSNALVYNVRIDNNGAMLVVKLYNIIDFKSGEDMTPSLHFLDSAGNVVSYQGVNPEINEHIYTSNIHWGFGITTGSESKKMDIIMLFPLDKALADYIADADIKGVRVQIAQNIFDYTLKKYELKIFKKNIDFVSTYL